MNTTEPIAPVPLRLVHPASFEEEQMEEYLLHSEDELCAAVDGYDNDCYDSDVGAYWEERWLEERMEAYEQWEERWLEEQMAMLDDLPTRPPALMRPVTPEFHVRKRRRTLFEEGDSAINKEGCDSPTAFDYWKYHHAKGRLEWETYLSGDCDPV